jgi:hypothetical protein
MFLSIILRLLFIILNYFTLHYLQLFILFLVFFVISRYVIFDHFKLLSIILSYFWLFYVAFGYFKLFHLRLFPTIVSFLGLL